MTCVLIEFLLEMQTFVIRNYYPGAKLGYFRNNTNMVKSDRLDFNTEVL